jgi:hypothetical protein
MVKAYDDVDGKFNIKLDKVLHLMRGNSKQDEDPATYRRRSTCWKT